MVGHHVRTVSSMTPAGYVWQAWCETDGCAWKGPARRVSFSARAMAEEDAEAHRTSAATSTEASGWRDPVRAALPDGELVGVQALDGGNFTDVVQLAVRSGSNATRLIGRSSRREEGDKSVVRAGEVVRALANGSVPVPALVWSGRLSNGRVGTLLTYVDGVTATGLAHADLTAETARVLGLIHDTPLASLPELDPFPLLPTAHLREWIAPHPRADELVRLVEAGAKEVPESEPVLVHGDYWTGNLLWAGSEIVGVLDWDNASVGSAAVDLAKTRLDLALRFGVARADGLLHDYRAFRPLPADQAFWDLRLALEGMPDPGRWWLPTYRRLGIDDLTEAGVRRRFDEYLDACTARLLEMPTRAPRT